MLLDRCWAKSSVMKHQTERDPFAAGLLEWSNRTGSITSNGNSVDRAETSSDKQAGWSGQAANIRVQGNQSESGQPEENHRVEIEAGVITRKHKHG